MKKLIMLSLLLFLTVFVFSQNIAETIDSIEQIGRDGQNILETLRALNQLSSEGSGLIQTLGIGTLIITLFPIILTFWLIIGSIAIILIIITSLIQKKRGYFIKSKAVAYLLWFFLGFCSAHRFYLGKYGSAILYLLTGQLFGIGWIVDLFILSGQVDIYNALYGKTQENDKNIVINVLNPNLQENSNSSSEKIPVEKQILALSEKSKSLTLQDIIRGTNFEIDEIELSLNKLIEKGLCKETISEDGKKEYAFN